MPSISESAEFLFCTDNDDVTLIVQRYEEDVRVLVQRNGTRWEDENATIADLRAMVNVLERIIANAEAHPFAKTSKAKQQ